MTHTSIQTDTQPLESPRARYEEREESEARPMTRIAFGMLLANALLLVKDLLFGKTPKAAAHETDADDAPGSLAADAVGLADESWSSTQQPGLDEALADAPLAFAPLRLGTGLGAATDAAAADVSVNRLTFHGSSTLPRAPSNDNEPVQPLSFRAPAADGGGGGGGETAAPSNPYLPGDDDDDDDDGTNRAPVVTARVSLSDMLVSQSIVIASFELLRSAFDPDGDALSVGNLWASSGSLAANASGGWVYTPTHGRAGEVVITYTVSDGTHLVPQYALLNVLEADDTAADATAAAAPAASSDGVAARTTSLELQPLPDLPPAVAAGSETVIAGTDGDDVIVGTDGDDIILAGAGDDVIDARAGDDAIDAGTGDDTVIASSGDGDDRIDGGAGSDTLDMSAIDADITVDLDTGAATSDDTGSDTLASIENVATGAGDDTVIGSDDANTITTGAGDDAVTAGAGDDTITTGDGSDNINAGAGDDTIDAGAGDDTIVVSAVNAPILAATDDMCDAVASGDGDAVGDEATQVASGDGDDRIDGGAGSDTLDMSAIDADITVDLVEGAAQSDATGSDTLASIENVATGDGADAVTGSDDANTITTGAGDDAVTAGAGDDTVASGDGSDTIDGGSGDDAIDAGAGDDVIVVSVAVDEPALTAPLGGCDAVASGDGEAVGDEATQVASDDSGAVASGDGDDAECAASGDGFASADVAPQDAVASGDGDGAECSASGDGDDRIDGGAGSDTLDMSAIDADITIDLDTGVAQSDATGSDTLASIENVVTGAGDDAVVGSDDANVISTAGGDDAIVAAAGDDLIASGDGDDVVDGGAGCDTIDAGAGDDTIVVSASDAACDAVATGDGDGCGDSETSNASGDGATVAAACGDGDDLIDGGDGSDTLDMSAIDADITVDLAEGVAESDATGSDTLASIENVVTGDGDDAVVGSGTSNRIATGGGADVIAAAAGDDVIDAGAGSDVIDAGDGDDIVIAASGDGDDVIDGGEGSDTLDMSAIDTDAVIDLSAGTAQSEETGSDTLAGIENVIAGSGDDTIVANDAVNDLFGGEGDDVFVFTSSLSAGNGEGSRDRILDFDVGDRIDIEDISREFADQFEDALVEEGIRRFVLLRDSAEFSEPGQLRIQYEDLDDGSSVTIIEGNLDDDADTEFQIELVGHHDMADDQFYHR